MRTRLALIVCTLLVRTMPAATVNLPYSLQVFAGSNNVGDGGSAIHSPLGDAEGITSDRTGNIYIADAADSRIRKIAPDGAIQTFYGTGAPGPLNLPYGISLDNAGNLYVADLGNNRILKITPDGVAKTLLDHLSAPRNVLVDFAGNVYFSEFSAHRVRKLSPDGTVTLVAGTGAAGSTGDGGLATAAALNSPAGLALDSLGALYIADSGNHKIRRVAAGRITTVLGTGVAGQSASAQLYSPTAVLVDSFSNIYIADSGNRRIRRLSASGVVSTIPGSARDLSLAADTSLLAADGSHAFRVSPAGIVTILAGDGSYNNFGDGGPASLARLNQPGGVAADSTGTVWIADTANARLRQVTPQGIIKSFGSNLVSPSGLSLDAVGNLFIADIAANRIRSMSLASNAFAVLAGTGLPGLGGEGLQAEFSPLSLPAGVAAAPAGAFYIADTANNRIRRAYVGSFISTVAGTGAAGFNGEGGALGVQLKNPSAVALDPDGNLWIADTGNNRIRKLSVDGTITTVAGPEQLNQPRGLAIDIAGNLWIADTGNHRVLVMPPGGILTVVSDEFVQPVGLSIDPAAGIVYVADQGANRVYRLIPPPPALIEAPASFVIVNAATLLAAPFATGSLITVFGSNLKVVQAYFDGDWTPTLAPTDSQFNLQIPSGASGAFELRSATATTVTSLLKTTLGITASAPGIFTAPGGSGQAIAANQDGGLNSASNPASAGSIVTFYATGIGLNTTVTATVGDTQAGILFAGEAPGLRGISQINALIPPGLIPGSQPLNIQAGSGVSQAGVIISIR